MSGLRVRGCPVLYRHGDARLAIVSLQTGQPNQIDEEVRRALIDGGEAGYTDCPTRGPGHKRRIRSPSTNPFSFLLQCFLKSKHYLQRDSGRITGRDRRLDASRCNPVASKGAIEQAPLRNEGPRETGQELVN